ncbi:MAG: TlpA family protein disulfide reductase [Candidatus Eremiobacteraeota bacterium]|nr:TlpA family protein disulfide reductase [Candidatus Eremiobacteraeota bacterium]MBV8374980.1 TlpA family protein disulfide reductase [Candidatus Eremiobacteraeota bacterium]
MLVVASLIAALTVSAGTGLAGISYAQAPPNFAIPTTRGTEYLSQLRGRVVIIDFWATWCDVCTKEMKYFVQAQQQYGDKVAVVTVSDELHDVAASYFRTWNIGLPLVEDLDGAISRIYSIAKIPDTLVLDPEGRVSYVSVGGLSWDELQSAIDRAAGQATSP